MTCGLPAELLIEILSPSLLVPDAMFADNGAVSPFSKVDRPASNALLVCKDWMRVVTPLLYYTVTLRSMAQANALEFALTNNPEFGKFIRRLRIEGSYGDIIWELVKAAPNVIDLCMTLSVRSDVSSAGLIRSLAYIKPRSVVLTLAPKKPIMNKNHKALLDALCCQISLWTRLTTFRFAGTGVTFYRQFLVPDYVAFPTIVTALCTSPSLEEVQLTVTDMSKAAVDAIHRLIGANSKLTLRLCKSSEIMERWFDGQVEELHTQTSAQFRSRILTVTP